MSIFFHISAEELKHLSLTAKLNAKDTSSNLRNVYILHRHARAYVIACDGHHAPIYVYNGMRDDKNSAYVLSWEDVEALASLKAKNLRYTVELDDRGGTIACGPISCKLKKVEECYLVSIFERFENCAKRGKLVPSPAMHLMSATQCRNIFPGKECTLEFLQEAGKPESAQFCTSPSYPNFCAILMPIKSDKYQMGKAIKQTRAFFSA